MTMPDFQWYPWNLNLIKNLEDNIVFFTQKVFNSENFSISSYKQEMRKSVLQRNRKTKINCLKKLKHAYQIHTWSDIAFNGTVVNQALPSLYEESLKINPFKEFCRFTYFAFWISSFLRNSILRCWIESNITI